ncbi:hypothetical protein NDU88_002043 [Pleurodeles waltl]|uniref:Tumor protein D52 n=1 Tax=Pleurodeles waltl TaxID=8319 RepID=A0AAV7UYF6_PLEWA|nr:hypothetical protein NDU88_002043 [Pleurodeles waltl]
MYSGVFAMDAREVDLEDYHSPFDFDSGVNRNYLFLSPGENLTPPGSPILQRSGSPITGNVPVGEDALKQNTPETLSEEEQEELRKELEKVEDEINTLSQVLAAKEKHLAEIKRKLGVTALTELKQNISKGLQDVASTTVYKKTTETLSQAGQKASAAFSSVGSAITKKLEDVKNSPTFKSFEETVETLKTKVGGTKPAGGDFGEVLNSAANASANEPLIEHSPETQ